MRTNFNELFLRAFLKKKSLSLKDPVEEIFSEIVFKELSTACAINILANTISKCEFRTFVDGEPVKHDEYYLWNIEPNQNQNSSDMLQQFITNLCYDNEALIVEVNGNLYVADSFSRRRYALYDDLFSNIVIGNITLQTTFPASDVIYCELNNIDVRRRLEGSYTSYGQTVVTAVRDVIRANGQKGILDIDATTQMRPKFTEELDILMNQRFKPFFESNQAVLPLTQGYKYTDVTKGTPPSPSDLNERINYEFEMAGRAFRIPKAIMLGDVSDVEKITKNFLTFAIDPLADKIGEEITRKRYGIHQYVKGCYLDVNTNCIQHIDIFEQAVNADKLLASGLYCIDELRTKLGDIAIGKDWSQKHYITKNYEEAEAMKHL